MKTKLAVWYMEVLWLKLGALRGTRLFHGLFNKAFAARRGEYLRRIMSLPVPMSEYQSQRASDLRHLLTWARTAPLPVKPARYSFVREFCLACQALRPHRFTIALGAVQFRCTACLTDRRYVPAEVL